MTWRIFLLEITLRQLVHCIQDRMDMVSSNTQIGGVLHMMINLLLRAQSVPRKYSLQLNTLIPPAWCGLLQLLANLFQALMF